LPEMEGEARRVVNRARVTVGTEWGGEIRKKHGEERNQPATRRLPGQKGTSGRTWWKEEYFFVLHKLGNFKILKEIKREVKRTNRPPEKPGQTLLKCLLLVRGGGKKK